MVSQKKKKKKKTNGDMSLIGDKLLARYALSKVINSTLFHLGRPENFFLINEPFKFPIYFTLS